MYKKRCFVSVGLSPMKKRTKNTHNRSEKKGEKMQKPKERTIKIKPKT